MFIVFVLTELANIYLRLVNEIKQPKIRLIILLFALIKGFGRQASQNVARKRRNVSLHSSRTHQRNRRFGYQLREYGFSIRRSANITH